MEAATRHAITFIFTITSALFLFSAMAGSEGVVAWSVLTFELPDCTFHYSAGLRKYAIEKGAGDGCNARASNHSSEAFLWSSDTCDDSRVPSGIGSSGACVRCFQSGGASLAFSIFAFFALVVSAGAAGALFRAPHDISDAVRAASRWGQAVLCFCMFVMWVSWAGSCDHSLKHDVDCVNCTVKVRLSAGWACAFMGFWTSALAAANEWWMSPAAPDNTVEVASKSTMVSTTRDG